MNPVPQSGHLSLLVDAHAAADVYAPIPAEDIVTAATSEHPEYDLAKIYHAPLRGVDAIAYRHEIFRDLEDSVVLDGMSAFTTGMRKVRAMLDTAKHLCSRPEINHWHLAAALHYIDVLNRIHRVLDTATKDSLIILNETFGSTSLQDGRVLGAAVLRDLLDLGALGIYVTFIDELTQLDPAIVSMKSLVDPADVTVRTFKVERHPADGRACARALAAKYGLDYDSIIQGVSS